MTDFEKECNDINDNNFDECVVEWTKTSKIATVTFPNHSRYNTKIKKLAKEFPEEVEITHENKDGSIVAHIPVRYIKINRQKRIMTEEQKKEFADRMKSLQTR